jgi:Family of unknown function (DUF6444)
MTAERPFSQELWHETLAAVQGYISGLGACVTPLEVAVQWFEATVQHLMERLQQDPRTSSPPPSSDPSQAISRRPRYKPSGRRRSGQPGRDGQQHAWLWAAVMAWVTVFVVGSCPQRDTGACKFRRLHAADPTGDGAVARSGPNPWRSEDGRDVSREPRPRLSDSGMRSGVVRQDRPFLAAYACRNRTAHAPRSIARAYG